MGMWLIQQIEERIGPKDRGRRARYYSVLGVIGIGLAVVMGVRWLIAH